MSLETWVILVFIVCAFLLLLNKLLHLQDKLNVALDWLKFIEKKLKGAEFSPEQERALMISSNIQNALIDYWVHYKADKQDGVASDFYRVIQLCDFSAYWQKQMERKLKDAQRRRGG